MTDLSILLADIRNEIDVLISSGISRAEAEQQAVTSVLARAAYAHTTTPHETRLLSIIDRISSETRRPVATHRICSEVGMEYFAAYYHLRNLERRGLLHRPAGPRSGWRVA